MIVNQKVVYVGVDSKELLDVLKDLSVDLRDVIHTDPSVECLPDGNFNVSTTYRGRQTMSGIVPDCSRYSNFI